jgi:hypothetical protein
MLEIVRWNDDDAITHDPLRMRTTNLTKLDLSEPIDNGKSSVRI